MTAVTRDLVVRGRTTARMNDGYAGNGGSEDEPGTQDELTKPHLQNLKLQYGAKRFTFYSAFDQGISIVILAQQE